MGDDFIYYYDVVKNGEQARIAVDDGNLSDNAMYHYNYNESKFNGDTVYGTEPGVYEADATKSILKNVDTNTNQEVDASESGDYIKLSNIFINPNSNVIVGKNGAANTQFLYGDATVVDITSYVQGQAVKEVVTGATLKSGMDVTIVYAVENNLRVAKTFFITDNKEGTLTPPPAGGVSGLNETYSISMTSDYVGSLAVTDRVGEGEDGASLIRTVLMDAGYTNITVNGSGTSYTADAVAPNGLLRTLNVTVTNAYKVSLSVATAQQSNYSVTSATTLWMKASDALTVTVKKASGNWAGSESSVALTSNPATYTFTAGSYSFGSGSSDTATFTLTAPANLAAAVSVELGAIS